MRVTSLLFILSTFCLQAQNPDFHESFDSLVDQLSHDSFEKRSKAQHDLLKLSEKHPTTAARSIRALTLRADDPELVQRATTLLKDLYDSKFSPSLPGYLGIRHGQAETVINGKRLNAALIITVVPGTPAAKAGLLRNDMIIEIDDTDFTKIPIAEMRDTLSATIKNKSAGDEIRLKVWRMNRIIQLKAKLAPFPQGMMADPDYQSRKYKEWLLQLDTKK